MEALNSPPYCPLPENLMNISIDPSDTTVRLSPANVFTVILHGFIAAIGILENLLVLGLVGFRVRRTIISIWVLNLSASSLMKTHSLPFFTYYMAQGRSWTLGVTMCRLLSSIFFLDMFVSGFLLAAISLDRCLIVIRPVWAQNYRNIRSVGKICGLIWMCSLLCTIPFFLFRDAIPRPDGMIECYSNYALFLPAGHFDILSLCELRHRSLVLMKFFLAFLMPLLIITTSYTIVSVNLKQRGWHRPFRFVRLVVAMVVCFILCWAPYHFFGVLGILVSHESPLQESIARALPVTVSITFLNSILDPILYVFTCPDLCSRIKQPLSTLIESVLAEDLMEMARRRSIHQSSWQKGSSPLPTGGLCVEEEQEPEFTQLN